jgi:hypothetical protein
LKDKESLLVVDEALQELAEKHGCHVLSLGQFGLDQCSMPRLRVPKPATFNSTFNVQLLALFPIWLRLRPLWPPSGL